MSGILIQAMNEEGANNLVQADKPKIQTTPRFTIRAATESDIPEIKKIRQEMGIHDVPSVFQTFMKLDPEGFQIALNDSGEIIGSCCSVFNGDDSDGMYFGGIFFIKPKFQGTGIGNQLYTKCFQRLGSWNCGQNAVPSMAETYIDRGGFRVEEKNWLCLKNYTPNYVSPAVLSNIVPTGVEILPFQNSFLSEMVEYDHALIGFRRSLLLSLSCNEVNSKTFVAFKNGECVGFGTIKESCLGAGRVGPFYADDPAVAEVILRKLLESYPNRNGFAMMTVSTNKHANSFLKRLGCPVTQKCIRLYTRETLNVDTSKIYSFFDLNFTVF